MQVRKEYISDMTVLIMKHSQLSLLQYTHFVFQFKIVFVYRQGNSAFDSTSVLFLS
jgi:hypothetical protein